MGYLIYCSFGDLLAMGAGNSPPTAFGWLVFWFILIAVIIAVIVVNAKARRNKF